MKKFLMMMIFNLVDLIIKKEKVSLELKVKLV